MLATNEQLREQYLQRIAVYKSLGYDRPAAAAYVVDQLGRIDSPVLDVGTGQGLLATELARRGADVVSVDASEEEQRVGVVNATCEGVLQHITFLSIDARNLPFAGETFGAVATLDALHHFDDGPAVFSEMRRVVRPSGKILLAELSPAGLRLVGHVHESEGRVHPVGRVTISSAVEWFVSNGFRVIASEEGHLHSVRILQMARHTGE